MSPVPYIPFWKLHFNMLNVQLQLVALMVILASIVNADLEWDARLVGGPLNNEGRLEVRPAGGLWEWGSLCQRNSSDPSEDDAWRVDELACGMCREMGYLASYTASNHRYDYGRSDGVIWYNGGNCNCGMTSCLLQPWTFDYNSCDHRSDISMTCMTTDIRLSNGSTDREGWLEVGLGGDRWVSIVEPLPHYIEDADLVCRHFGYPLALSVLDSVDLPTTGAYPERRVVKNKCTGGDNALTECLSKSFCINTCDYQLNFPLDSHPLGVKCATDDEVLALNDTRTTLPENTELRLANGNTELDGILQLQYNGSGWGYACFRDDKMIPEVASDVCHYLGSLSAVSMDLHLASSGDGGVEYMFRVGRYGEKHWLKVTENHCAKTGGNLLTVSCKEGFTLHGITVYLPDFATCEGRCGIPPSLVHCGCDTLCHAFKDCCFDVLSICLPDPSAADGSQEQSSLYNLTSTSQYYRCLEVSSLSTYGWLSSTYQLISKCPVSWQDPAVRDYCEVPNFAQAIIYDTGDISIPFKNAMCALCHGLTAFRVEEGDPIYSYPYPDVPVGLPPGEDNVSISVINDPPPPDYFISVFDVFAYRPIDSFTDAELLHACSPNSDVVSECPLDEDIPDGLREACADYTAQVSARHDQRKFKNPHCALCHGMTFEDLILGLDVLVFVPHIEDDPDLSNPDVLRGPQPLFIEWSLAVTLGEEITCHSKDFIVSARASLGKDTTLVFTERDRQIHDVIAVECLLRAVAFSNIDIVANFGELLEQSIMSILSNTGNIAPVSSPGFLNISEIEAVLDDILVNAGDSGDRDWTDWGSLCNAEGITLNEECVVVEGNDNEGECFQTSANITTATVNQTMYLYIGNSDLITPLNVSFMIDYETDGETTSFVKRKFVNVCGVRPKDKQCDFLSLDQVTFIQDGDRQLISYHGARLDESYYAILPDGNIMICTFTTLYYEDPFAGPENIVNTLCLSLSLTSLAATILTYCVFPTLRNIHGLTVLSMSVAIFVGQSLFLFASNQTGNPEVCAAVAITTHYAWLAAFAWMTVLAWDFMRTFSAPVNRAKNAGSHAFLRFSLLGWCAPFLVLIPCLVVNFCDCTGINFSYGRVETKICWISDSSAVLVSFALPIGVSLCLNTVFFLSTVHSIRSSKKASSLINKDKSKRKEATTELIIYIKISSAMGFAWIIGFVALATNVQVLWYLFIIAGSLQGVFIFTSFAFNKRVRSMWREKLRPKKRTPSADVQSPQKEGQRDTEDTGTTSV